MRVLTSAVALALIVGPGGAGHASAEVTRVTIAARSVVADGRSFGQTGPYEKLSGTVEFALDPSDRRNARIADLDLAPRDAEGRVRFTSDLYVLRPSDPARGNGALLFEVSNRGNKGLLTRFNRARGSIDPTAPADFGDGFLMKEGYTLVWVGWQFDIAPPRVRIQAPAADLRSRPLPDTIHVTFIVNEKQMEAGPADLPQYLPAIPNDPAATLTVRDRYWDRGTVVARERWRFVTSGERPRVALDSGFEPGRVYELNYRATGARVAGVGMAALRDVASAFLRREDLPVRGRTAYIFGASQSGRFLRQFLQDGFNEDERGRRAFDAVWPHIAGAGLGSFNERFAMPGYASFPATRFPFTDLEQRGPDGTSGGILASYRPEHLPKVMYTNTSVEYWGQGRAAALTHTSVDGVRDVAVPDNVRMYLLSGTQHGEAAFPPALDNGQARNNPTPQSHVMRALLRSLHGWASEGTRPPDSRYPRLGDATLTPLATFRFPAIQGIRDPRTIEGPGRLVNGQFAALPFLVPGIDADGNEVAGIRVPEVSVPLATTTGWNFRAERIGNPSTFIALVGSYIPLPRTRAEREAMRDPRRSIEERYRGREDYVQRVGAAAADLVRGRYLLEEDVADVMRRAETHWEYSQTLARTNPTAH